MLSPKIDEKTFKINLNFDNQWLTDFPTASKILDEAPYKVTAHIDPSFNLTFEYSFSLKNKPDLGTREIKGNVKYDKNIKGLIKPNIREVLEQKEYTKEKFDNDEFSHWDTLRVFNETCKAHEFKAAATDEYKRPF